MWCETHTYAYLATFNCTLMLYYLFLVYRENINLKLFSQTPDTSLQHSLFRNKITKVSGCQATTAMIILSVAASEYPFLYILMTQDAEKVSSENQWYMGLFCMKFQHLTSFHSFLLPPFASWLVVSSHLILKILRDLYYFLKSWGS